MRPKQERRQGEGCRKYQKRFTSKQTVSEDQITQDTTRRAEK